MDISTILGILSVVFSGIAAIGACVAVVYSKRQIYVDSISKQRFEWMERVRTLIGEFVVIYFDDSVDSTEKSSRLVSQKMRILLYVDSRKHAGYDNSELQTIIKHINECIDSRNEDINTRTEYANKLIEAVQTSMAITHSRAKQEAEKGVNF